MARALACGTALALAMAAAPGLAQQRPSGAEQSQGVRQFNIPAQSLTTAVTAFGDQADLQVTVDGAILSGLSSQAVAGRFSPAEALSRLLTGTGITYRWVDRRSVALERAPKSADGAIQLGPVRVEGEGSGGASEALLEELRLNESPTGPGRGYVASRSLSGTKTDRPLVEVPQSISVVTRQQISDLQPADINKALRYTVGIAPEIRGAVSHGEGGFSMTLRGFNPDFYMDGLKVDYNIDIFDAYLIDRIEVVSGPASVLYGQASPGGFVNIGSKLPTAEPVHEIQLLAGSWGQYRANLDLGGPLTSNGDLLYRFVATGLTSGSQVDQVHTKRVSIAPSIAWDVAPSTKLTVIGKYIKNFDKGPGTQLPVYGTVLPNVGGQIPTGFYLGDSNYDHNPVTSCFIGYTLDHQFSDRTFFRQSLRYGHSTADGARLQLRFVLFPSPSNTLLGRTGFPSSDDIKSFSVDNQLGTSIPLGAADLELVAGLDYQRFREYSTIGYDYSLPPIDFTNPVYGIDFPRLAVVDRYRTNSHLDQLGVYGQATLKRGGLRLTLGGRHDHAGIETASLSPGETATPSLSDVTQNKFTWRAGAVYLFDNGVAPYASYTTSFQPQVGVAFGGRPYLPTLGRQYEAGIKFQPTNMDAFFTASAYHLTKQNVLSDDLEHPGFSIETGEVRVRGAELSVHANPISGLSLLATYAYTDARITKSDVISFGADGEFGPIQGKRPYDVPKHSASFLADYTFRSGSLAGLGINAGIRHIGAQYGDDTNTFTVRAFTLFDAGLKYDLTHLDPSLAGLRMQINASNLFDKTYVSGCNGPNFCYWGERRNITGTLAYSW